MTQDGSFMAQGHLEGRAEGCGREQLRVVEVVAAAIVEGGKVLATQRGYGTWKGWWEFPGGKVEPAEGMEEALRRELREEMALEVEVKQRLATIDYDYPDFHLTMHLFCCLAKGRPMLLEHSGMRWLSARELDAVRWLPADVQLMPRVAAMLEGMPAAD